MSKKFYIGICCLALLATSVASGYTEDFEGYTRNAGRDWDLTPEFNASGWVDLYRMKNGAPLKLGANDLVNLAVGYNSAQGVVGPKNAGGAHLLDAPQGPSSTFVYTATMKMDHAAGRLYWGTSADLLDPGQSVHDSLMDVILWHDEARLEAKINGVEYNTDFIDVGVTWSTLDWMEVKVEVDTNASSRATTVRTYYRDLEEEDGSGPVGDGSWTQIDWGDAGGGWDLNMDGPDHKIEAIGFMADNASVFFDNLVATVDVPFVELTFTFVQMCDTQLGFGGYENDVARFEQAVKQINTLKPDFVVICGDLVDDFDDDDSVADFKRIKAGFAVSCYCAPGNHDVGNVPTIASLKRYRTLIGKDYYSFEHKGYAFVITNSQLWDRYLEGESEKQDSWLKETLKAASKKGSPIFVVGHYPLFRNTADEKRGYYMPVEKRNELLSLFEAHGVVAVLTGHAHRLIINRYKDIQLVTGETTSKNFDKRPFGFRLWRVTESKPAEHEFVPLQNRVTESKSAEHEFVPLQN